MSARFAPFGRNVHVRILLVAALASTAVALVGLNARDFGASDGSAAAVGQKAGTSAVLTASRPTVVRCCLHQPKKPESQLSGSIS
jgi:hypothetical protein